MRYIDIFIWALGVEALLYSILGFFSIQWGKKLNMYLRQNQSQFYKEKLDVPFLAGGPEVMKKHYNALKFAYWGEMPDELSKRYQKKMKFFAKLGILSLLILFITLIAIILIAPLLEDLDYR